MTPCRREIRGVGFQHNRAQRQLAGQAPYLQRAGVGHRAAETKPEPEIDERLRLLKTAIEYMRDATDHLEAAQMLEQYVLRAAHVQQHRQFEFTCQL